MILFQFGKKLQDKLKQPSTMTNLAEIWFFKQTKNNEKIKQKEIKERKMFSLLQKSSETRYRRENDCNFETPKKPNIKKWTKKFSL